MMAEASPKRRPLAETAIANIEKRMDELQKIIQKDEQRAQELRNLEIVQAVERETALNSQEKETYGNFLKEEFFTKADFGKLDKFYAHGYEKLSEDGKEQMDHRLWEGVRRHEYKISDLPANVQEIAAARVNNGLTKGTGSVIDSDKLSETDRNDFTQAYKSGDKKAAIQILDRAGFQESVALTASGGNGRSSGEEEKKSQPGQNSQNRGTPVSAEPFSAETKKTMGDIDLSSVNLGNLKLKDAPEKTSSADVPHNAQPGQQPAASASRA